MSYELRALLGMNALLISMFLYTIIVFGKKQKIIYRHQIELLDHLNHMHVRQQLMEHRMGYEVTDIDEVQTH